MQLLKEECPFPTEMEKVNLGHVPVIAVFSNQANLYFLLCKFPVGDEMVVMWLLSGTSYFIYG